ncbi:MAG: 23S rRNA (uracil(1939)-C(5))-methyltransferase RlmD [Gemmatimonadetes bacterium]|nr:23S rRNA (uracil(1939)-C(5))-methyltransferase RlmD [Gemmatimonadota bacterium]
MSIEALDPAGAGLARSSLGETRVIGGLPGDVVSALFVSTPGRPPRAIAERILSPSADRRDPPCPIVGECGACPWMALSDAAQSEWKTEIAARALDGIARVRPIHTSPHLVQYRNRTVLPVERHRGRIRIGYYRPRTHEVVDVAWCSVLAAPLQRAFEAVRQAIEIARPSAYDERWRHGVLRRVALRAGVRTDDLLVTLVSPKEGAEELGRLVDSLKELLDTDASIAVNIQPSAGNAVFGSKTRVVSGRGFVRERIRGRSVHLAATTFFQLNTDVAETLFERVLELAGDLQGARAADLYAGIGLVGLDLADAGADEVTIVERAEASLEEARRLADGNTKIRILEGDAATVLPTVGPLDIAITDPPRRGLGDDGVEAILANPPARIVHIACDISAMARDLLALTAGPYRVEGDVELFDMLPQTAHLEAVAVLVRE